MKPQDEKRLAEFKVNYAEYLAKDAGFSEPKIISIRKTNVEFLLSLISELEAEKATFRNDVLEEAHDRLALELARDQYGLRLRQRINILDVTFQRLKSDTTKGE